MDQTTLVERDIEAGQRLIRALDEAGYPVVAALWYYLAEEGEWRLMIASPRVNTDGPISVYTEIQRVLTAESIPLPLVQVSAVEDDNPVVTAFRLFAGTDGAPFLGGVPYSRTSVGDQFVIQAYLYRAERIVGFSGTKDVVVAIREPSSKVWRAYQGVLTFQNGTFADLAVDGYSWPVKRTKAGLNMHLDVLEHVQMKKGQATGDVSRWTVIHGRLRSVNKVATGVRIEGLPVTRAAS